MTIQEAFKLGLHHVVAGNKTINVLAIAAYDPNKGIIYFSGTMVTLDEEEKKQFELHIIEGVQTGMRVQAQNAAQNLMKIPNLKTH